MSNDHQLVYSLEIRLLELQERVDAIESALQQAKKPNSERGGIVNGGLPEPVLREISAGENPVRAIRRHRLLTQKDLSDRCGIRANHISAIERGKSYGLKTAKRLAEALDVPVDLLK